MVYARRRGARRATPYRARWAQDTTVESRTCRRCSGTFAARDDDQVCTTCRVWHTRIAALTAVVEVTR